MGPLIVTRRRKPSSVFPALDFFFSARSTTISWPTLASLALLSLLILLIPLLLGFFKGTSADQDRRFSDKELKLLKSIKFPPQFDTKVFPFTFSPVSL
jgi:hypothetical protein